MTDIAALIITYNRPAKVSTWALLDRCGFTGPKYLLVSDDDPSLDEYQARYPEAVIVFNKIEAEAHFDRGDNFPSRNASVYPRGLAHQLMADRGHRWFWMLDDDYSMFEHRFSAAQMYLHAAKGVRSLDPILEAMRDFAESTGVLLTFSQGGDWVGGPSLSTAKTIHAKRKAMNSFLCDTEHPIVFDGKLNEDVNLYTEGQRRGDVLPMMLSCVSLEQLPSQSNEGGITDLYRAVGTYVKSMYSVIRCPSAVQVQPMPGGVTPRLHHNVNYDACAPKILHERHRKATP